MTRAFLLGGRGGGGEEVFVRDLAATPPPGVTYEAVLDHHASTPGARALTSREVLFNRLVHPLLWPLLGLRAYDLGPAFDLVHVHNYPVSLRGVGGRPVVFTLGGSGYPHYLETYLGWTPEAVAARYRRARGVYRALGIRSEVATHEGVDAVVVFSAFAAGHLARYGVPERKLHVVPPGFAMPAPAPRETRTRPFTFVLVGRDPERKGADLAVAALRRVRARGVAARLVLVGDAAYPGWREEAVEGYGPVPREVLFRDFLGGADALLAPSRAEGYGFAAVEGMGAGLPVVASARDALPEILGDTGILVEPGDAEALAAAMAELATDPVGAAERGRAARARFEETFTLDVARAGLGRVYREVLA